MGHHQHRLGTGAVETPLMLGQEAIGEAPSLVHQLQKGVVAPPIGVLQLHRFRSLPPAALLFRSVYQQILAPQAAPGGEVDFQEFIHVERILGRTMGRQQQGGRLAGPLQRRAVDSLEGHIAQGLAGAASLLGPLLGQCGEVVAALDSPFLVETAQAMANEQDPEGHGSGATGIPSYGSGLMGPFMGPALLACAAVPAGDRGESPHLPP